MNLDLIELAHRLLISMMAIFALMNPFGNLPQFLTMTDGVNSQSRRKIFAAIVLTSFLIVIFFTVTGQYIMHYLFKIELYHLRVAGGIILIVMGIKNLMFATQSGVAILPTDTVREMINKSIIPMAFPMMVGPGTLSTVIVMSDEIGMVFTLSASLVAFILMFMLFFYAAVIERVAGKLILHVIARIMQVFIVAIGVKMLSGGVKDTITNLTALLQVS